MIPEDAGFPVYHPGTSVFFSHGLGPPPDFSFITGPSPIDDASHH